MDGNVIKEFKTTIDNIIDVSPDGTKFITAMYFGGLKLWNTEGRSISDFKEGIYPVRYSPDATKILTGSNNGFLSIWTIEGELLKEFKGKTDTSTSIPFPYAIDAIAISKDETKILAVTSSGLVKLWNIEGRLLGEFTEMGEIENLDFSLTELKF
jgi:WD40 repeat protein